jgi:hypothetical protein
MIVFLDIDGVMVHANPHRIVEVEDDGFYRFKSNAISALNSIKCVDIILSTSHRHRFQLNEWEHIFEKRGVHFNSISIIETKSNYISSRKEEIEEWISIKSYEYNEFIIIDDDKSLNALPKKLKERLVLTNSYLGLEDDSEIKKFLKLKKIKKSK